MNDKEYYASQISGSSVKFEYGKRIPLNEDTARIIIEKLSSIFPIIAEERRNEILDSYDG